MGRSEFHVDVEAGINRVTLRGAQQLPCLWSTVVTGTRDPDWRPGRHYLVDLSEASLEGLDGASLIELGDRIRSRWRSDLGTRVAVVAPWGIDFERARVFRMLNARLPFEFQVFVSTADAERWLRRTSLWRRVSQLAGLAH